MNKKIKEIFTPKDITLIALMTTIIFVQEQLLSFIPNFQLTIFLIVLFSKKLGLVRTLIICFIHTLLDNFIMGSFNIIYIPFMFIGWAIIPITLNTIFKKIESNIVLAFLGILFSFIYSWLFIIPNIFILNVKFFDYFTVDILWEVLLATSSFITILLLYEPCSKIFDNFNQKETVEE